MSVTNHKEMLADLKARREVLVQIRGQHDGLIKRLDDLIARMECEFSQPVSQ